MKSKFSADTWLALFFLAAAILIIFVWVPLDTGTGLVEKVRRKLIIGDALGPMVAGIIVAVGALLMLVRPWPTSSLTRQNLVWVAVLFVLFVLSLMLMRYAGPLLSLSLGLEGGYRPLRATAPWHYIGFVMGGTLMTGGLIALVEKKRSPYPFALGFAASLLIALIYDLPFDDLLLPPNGDV